MNGSPVTPKEIEKIIFLRRNGHSLPEIRKILNRGSSTVFRYIKGVSILPEYKAILKAKQGGSKIRSQKSWSEARTSALKLREDSNATIAAMLYWGEGAKKDLSFCNSDPAMVSVFIQCMQKLGVNKEDFKITIRAYDDLKKKEVIRFWSKKLGLTQSQVGNVNILAGKKLGKLQYGMCRVRVRKGGFYLKLLRSIIDGIKLQYTTTPS